MASSGNDSQSVNAEVVQCVKCQEDLFPYHRKWGCSGTKSHVTCNRCFMKLIEDKGSQNVRCPHKTCVDHYLHYINRKEKEFAHIYLDNSNFWIEAKKLVCRNFRLRSKEDPRMRLDITALTNVVACGREVATKSLYGSEPYKDSSMENLWRKFREHDWQTKVSKRKGREKAVDQQLVADLTLLVSDGSLEKGTAIILCGDADVTPAVSICLVKNWRCEVCMWKSGISQRLYELQRKSPQLIKVICLDQFIDEITFTSCKFTLAKLERMRHLKSQAAVIENVDFFPDKRWQREMTRRLRWPFEFCRLGSNKQDLLLVLVSCQDGVKDNKNAKDYFDEFFGILQQNYGHNVRSYVEYKQQRQKSTSKELPLASDNQYEVLEQELPRRLNEILRSDECQFRRRDMTPSPLHTPSRKSSVCSVNYFTSGYESLNSPWLSHSTSVTSLASSGFGDGLSTPHDGNESAGGEETKFTTVVKKKTSKVSLQLCKFKGKCSKRLKCLYRHTEEEKKFFMDPKKATLCWSIRKGCNGLGNCSFAHAPEEGFCRHCNKWGHLENDKCKGKGLR